MGNASLLPESEQQCAGSGAEVSSSHSACQKAEFSRWMLYRRVREC